MLDGLSGETLLSCHSCRFSFDGGDCAPGPVQFMQRAIIHRDLLARSVGRAVPFLHTAGKEFWMAIVPPSIAEFRKAYQQERVSRMYSGTVHLMLTVGASLMVVLYCLLQLKNVRPTEWLTIPVTFLYANIT